MFMGGMNGWTEGSTDAPSSFHVQSELDNVSSLLSQAEGKNIKSSKDLSSIESQLQDAQVQRLISITSIKSG